MKKNSLTFQDILDIVDKHAADNGNNPTHVFVDYVSFTFIMRDVNLNIHKYWLPSSHGEEQNTRGIHELTFQHSMGKTILKSVNHKTKFIMVGNEKAYLGYVVERELLGAQ